MESASKHDPYVPSGWPERVIELGVVWKGVRDRKVRDRALSELWLLLNAALVKYLRVHRERHGRIDEEDIRDIASEKSLELLRKLDQKQWDPTSSKPAQLCSFISTLARNGLIDHLRAVESKRPRGFELMDDVDSLPGSVSSPRSGDDAVDLGVDRLQFAEALRECALQLKPRTRTVWFLRVFLEMPSKRIATHPSVEMSPAAVDVALARCRDTIRECMIKKDFRPEDMPPGTFTVLWEAFQNELGLDDNATRT